MKDVEREKSILAYGWSSVLGSFEECFDGEVDCRLGDIGKRQSSHNAGAQFGVRLGLILEQLN